MMFQFQEISLFLLFLEFLPSSHSFHTAAAATHNNNNLLRSSHLHGLQQKTRQRGSTNDEFNCAGLPPALWCACDKVQEKCGTKQKCTEHANAVQNEPVHITLLYESLCPDCQRFISNKLYDVYQRFKDVLRVELIPFGNAKLLENGTIQCQHGPTECKINKFESCAIHYMHEPLPFIYCLETLIANGMGLTKASKQCYAKIHPLPHIYDQITHCFNGPKGDRLQKLDAQKTAAIWPDQHEFVPWILVNNASLQSQQFLMNDLPTVICQSYVGDAKIDQCNLSGMSANRNFNLAKEDDYDNDESDDEMVEE